MTVHSSHGPRFLDPILVYLNLGFSCCWLIICCRSGGAIRCPYCAGFLFLVFVVFGVWVAFACFFVDYDLLQKITGLKRTTLMSYNSEGKVGEGVMEMAHHGEDGWTWK